MAVLISALETNIWNLQTYISNTLGSLYIPGQFITLEDLSLDQCPKTPSGKIMKRKLAELVSEFRAEDKTNKLEFASR